MMIPVTASGLSPARGPGRGKSVCTPRIGRVGVIFFFQRWKIWYDLKTRGGRQDPSRGLGRSVRLSFAYCGQIIQALGVSTCTMQHRSS